MPKVELMPVTYNPDRLLMWADENFRRIADSINTLLTPSGSGAGAYVTPGLDIYHPGSSPFVDFHRAADPVGDSNADYSVRIVNDEASALSLYGTTAVKSNTGGKFMPGEAYIGSHPVHGVNGWAVFGNRYQQGVNDYAFMQSETGDVLVNSGGGDKRIRLLISGAANPQLQLDVNGIHVWGIFAMQDYSLRLRTWNDGNHALQFYAGGYGGSGAVDGPALWGHSGVMIGTHYQGVERWQVHVRDNLVYIREALYLNENNATRDDILRLGAWGDYCIGVRSETLYMRCYRSLWLDTQKYGALRMMEVNRDGNAGVWIGVGWYRTNEGDNGVYNHPRGQGLQFTSEGLRSYPNGQRLDAYLFDHLGAWTAVPIWTRSDGGGSGARITHRAAGQNAAPMWKAWGQAFEARSWDDGGFIPIRGVIENYCREASKESIVDAKQRLSKETRKQKQKALRTVHYKRKERGVGCANCLGTGEAVKNERIKSWVEMKKQHEKDNRPDKHVRVNKPKLPKEIADVVEAQEGEPCPDCNGKGMTWERPESIKSEEAGWFGFIAEEIEQQFPEAMFYRHDEDGVVRVSGADHMSLIAILWEDNKDQQEEIDALSARLEVLERKK